MDQKISGDEFVRGRVFNDSMSLYNDLCQRELDVYSHKKNQLYSAFIALDLPSQQ